MKDVTEEFKKTALKHKMKWYAVSSINGFLPNTSGARGVMTGGHVGNSQEICKPEERIMSTGIEVDLGKFSFDASLKNPCTIVDVVDRYKRNAIYGDRTLTKTIIFYDEKEEWLDYLDVNKYGTMDKQFGFEYNIDKDIMAKLEAWESVHIKEKTVIATPPSVQEGSVWGGGLNVNTVFGSFPETSNDPVVISQSTANAFAFKVYDKVSVEFGSKKIPKNLYGTKDNYKIHPDIGETLHESGTLMALMDVKENYAMSTMSRNSMMDFDPMFDEGVFLRGPEGKVVDIVTHYSPIKSKELHENMYTGAKTYSNALITYYRELVDAYKKANEAFKKENNYSEIRVSPRFTKFLADTMLYLDTTEKTSPATKILKKRPIDIFRIDFVVEYTMIPTVGYKATNLFGGKAVIGKVLPDHLMPIDKDGRRVGMIIDYATVISRMNLGASYEHYFFAGSRRVKELTYEFLTKKHTDVDKSLAGLSNSEMNECFDITLRFLNILQTKQFDNYKNITDVNEKKELIKEIATKECYFFYNFEQEKLGYEIVKELDQSDFAPVEDKITIFDEDGKATLTEEKFIVAPTYIILLNKIADTWLACGTANVNHLGMPVKASSESRTRVSTRLSAAKFLGETELRLLLNYVGDLGTAEIKDMSCSIETHEEIYRQYLSKEMPTDISKLIDRKVMEFGRDNAYTLIIELLRGSGIELSAYSDEGE